jgi:hypothetical protein
MNISRQNPSHFHPREQVLQDHPTTLVAALQIAHVNDGRAVHLQQILGTVDQQVDPAASAIHLMN